MARSLKLDLGGLGVVLRSARADVLDRLRTGWSGFASGPCSIVAEIEIRDDFEGGQDDAPVPAVFRHDADGWEVRDENWYSLAMRGSRGVLHFHERWPRGSKLVVDPGIYSALKSWLAVTLPAHRAVLLHAGAVRVDETAGLFLGTSGSGKSTLCGMFPNDDLINDELVAVRVSPTPEVSSTPFASACPGPRRATRSRVGAIAQLAKSLRVQRSPLSPQQAVLPLARCITLPSGTTEALERDALAFATELAARVPSYSFGFPLDPVAVADEVRAMLQDAAQRDVLGSPRPRLQ